MSTRLFLVRLSAYLAELAPQGFVLIPRLNIPIISLKPGLDLPRLGEGDSLSVPDKSRETGLSDIGLQPSRLSLRSTFQGERKACRA